MFISLLPSNCYQGPISFNEDEEDTEALATDENLDDGKCVSLSESASTKSEVNYIADRIDAKCQEDVEASVEIMKKKRRRLGKNPDVDTSFLPDIDRDEEEKRLR